jgi:hypothetical protein
VTPHTITSLIFAPIVSDSFSHVLHTSADACS